MDESEQANQKAIALISGNLAQVELDAIFSNLPSFYQKVDPTLQNELVQTLIELARPKPESIVFRVMDMDITE